MQCVRRWRWYRAVILVLAVAIAAPAAWAVESVTLTVKPRQVLHRIDPMIYGHFLEHIYHSVNGGLWGELIWNRSFEQNDARGWRVRDGRVVQNDMGENRRFVFGDPDWTDYEYSLEARKLGGNEGFLVLFRVQDARNFYWLNLGGWGNVRHQLERGRSGEGRWHGVGPSVDGKIEAGRWYRIRIRCEGNRVTAYLDDELLIDFVDSEPVLRGAVGVGTWATRAEYRNFKVTALDGKTLLEGLPPQQTAAVAVAKHWEAFGDVQVFVSDDAANSEMAQGLVVAGDRTGGLAQSRICVRHRETYCGSLWAKGKAQNLSVRLTDGERILASQTVEPPASEWQEIAFALEPKADCDDARLEIVVGGPAELLVDQVSMMPESWRKNGGFRPDLLEAVEELHPPIIRWPGGCFASAYRWKDGIGPQHERRVYPREIWDDLDVNSYGTDEFIAMCRKIGAEPLLVVNIGTKNWNPGGDPAEFEQDIKDWIEYCNGPADSKWGAVRAANGHPEPYNVKYWEIDNETWHMGVEAYIEAVKHFAPLMRRCDPSIKLIACGSGGYGRSADEWNRAVIEQCADLVDYLSIHHYENPDRFAEGPLDYEAFIARTGERIAASKNPDLKIFVSEWNAQSTDWRTGLYCGGILNGFTRQASVGMAAPALFLRHVSATAWDNAFINFDQARWFPAPNYVVMKLWHDHALPLLVASDGLDGLNVVAERSEDGRRLVVKIVNPRETAIDLTVAMEDAAAGGARAWRVAPGSLSARNTLEQPQAVKPEPANAAVVDGRVRLRVPGLAVSLVEIELAP
ncbi:family 16 glycoside hydrolase [Thermostilla marina]